MQIKKADKEYSADIELSGILFTTRGTAPTKSAALDKVLEYAASKWKRLPVEITITMKKTEAKNV
ncbi:MAG: hypothetical protein PVG39_04800 [Desulfobacteraceae bacterium]